METAQQKFARLHPDRLRIIKERYRNSPKGLQIRADGHFRYAYGLTKAQVDARIVEQGNRCSICQQVFTDKNYPCVDHDHACCPTYKTCGKCIRGIICFRCNTVLGKVHDGIEILAAMIGYVTRWRMK